MIKIIKQLAPQDQHYYLAVSMGVDSVAALFWLKSKGYNITPLHFNHNLREQNHKMEFRFKELCQKLNCAGTSSVGSNLKTEAECRTARLKFYEEAACGGKVITAHHLNDWVENYLLNCFRGHPNHMPFELTSHFQNYQIIHPFLLSTKKDFEQYLDRNKWMCYIVEDESNSVIKGSRRNWIRKNIILEMNSQKLSLEKFAKRKIEKLLLESVNKKQLNTGH